MTRSKKIVNRRKSSSRRKSRASQQDDTKAHQVFLPAISNHKQTNRVSESFCYFLGFDVEGDFYYFKYKTIDKHGRTVYTTETYRKQYKHNKLATQEKESFERIRVIMVPIPMDDVQNCERE